MSLVRVQVSFQGVSALPEDRYVNTFYVSGGTPNYTDASDYETLAEELSGRVAAGASLSTIFQTFYTTTVTPSNYALSSFMAGDALGAGQDVTFKCYDMNDPEIRIPFHTSTWNLPASTQPVMPQEVACAMTFKALPVSGVLPGRRRGRVYIGPLNTSACASGTGGSVEKGRPSAGLIGCITESGQRLAAQLATAGYAWVIHSPTTGPMAAARVRQVSCDNAFDTIRSRGLAPTVRTVLPVPAA